MLCPEVFSFPTTRNRTSHEIANYDKKGRRIVDKTIRSCAFNEMVSIILTGCETIPPAIKQLIDTSDHYLIRNIKLSDLIRRDFVEAFIKRGTLTGVSSEIETFSVCEDVFAITPDGKLILSINKDLYQIIGLEGRPVGLSKRNKERFEITIDLKNKNFHEQSKFYERIKNSLSRPEIEPFDFHLSWESIDVAVCPSSIAKFFNDCGYKVEQHSVQIHSTSSKNLRIPTQLLAQRKIDDDLAHAVAEYFATIMLACDTNVSQELNSYIPDSDLMLGSEHSTQAVTLHCKGFLASDFIIKLLEIVRLSADDESIIISVNGLRKAPVKATNGYIITLLKDKKYFLFTI